MISAIEVNESQYRDEQLRPLNIVLDPNFLDVYSWTD